MLCSHKTGEDDYLLEIRITGVSLIHLIGSVVPQTHIIMFMDCTHEEPLEDAAKNLIICQQKLNSCNTNGAP